MYRRAVSLFLCLLFLCGNAFATGAEITDYGNAVRLADLMSTDGTNYEVTFTWGENASFANADGENLSSPHVASVPVGSTLSGFIPILQGNGRVTWKDSKGKVYTDSSEINSNTNLMAQVQYGYTITLKIGETTYEIFTDGSVSTAQMIASDGTDFSQYTWQDSDGNSVTLLGYMPTSNITLTAISNLARASRTMNCYVCIDGTWTNVGTIGRVYGPYNTGNGSGSRYYLTTEQLDSVFSRYGFDAEAYDALPTDTWFGHLTSGENLIWTDTKAETYSGQKRTIVFGGTETRSFDLYYVPVNNRSSANLNQSKNGNNVFTIGTNIPNELEPELGSSRILAYVLQNTGSVTVELPWSEGVNWTWTGAGNVEQISHDDEKVVYRLSQITSAVRFTPEIYYRDVEFATDIGTYTYRLTIGADLGKWIKDHAYTVIGTDALSMTGTAETHQFREFEWRHLNGSETGTILSPNWVITENEPQTLKLEGLPRTRTIVFRANGGAWTGVANLVDNPWNNSLYQWLIQNEDFVFEMNNGTSIRVGNYIWSNAINNVPISQEQDIRIEDVNYGIAIVLNGTPRTYKKVTLHVRHDDDTESCTVTTEAELNQNILQWLDDNSTFIIDEGCTHAGKEINVFDYRFTIGDESTPIDQNDAVTEDINLYAYPRVYVAVELKDSEGGTTRSYSATPEEGYEKGQPILSWLTSHDGDIFGDKRIHDYTWTFGNQPITSSEIVYTGSDPLVLTANPKQSFTVWFEAGNGEWVGGQPPDAATASVYAGDALSKDTLNALAARLTPPVGQRFVRWIYLDDSSGKETWLIFDESTRVTRDMTVKASYAVCHNVTFFTDSSLEATITIDNFDNPVVVPHGETIPSDAYPYERNAQWIPLGQAFRYWVRVMDDGSHQVFSVNDPITEDINLYPVFTRIAYVFRNSEGTQLTSAYWGDEIHYVPPVVPEGKYYVGLSVNGAVIPNGTVATISSLTALGVIVPLVENGVRTFTDVEPLFADQHAVVYHADENSEFVGGTATAPRKQYEQVVDTEFITLGMSFIYRSSDASGWVLSGWTTKPDSGTIDYPPALSVMCDTIMWDENGELHLYPVWTVDENAVVITFETNYPVGAVDADGNLLENASYQVNAPKGSRPVFPYFEQTSFEMPANTTVVTGENGEQIEVLQYEIAGWSINQSGTGSDQNEGVYSQGTQYAGDAVEEDTTFYLRWLDLTAEATGTTAYFYIRDDGTLPQEPGTYVASSYFPTGVGTTPYNNESLQRAGALKVLVNVVNDSDTVSDNLNAQPSQDEILKILKWYDEHGGSATYQAIKAVGGDTDFSKWYVEWYAIKYTPSHRPNKPAWHVDGRVRITGTYRLDYMPNGGSNVPVGTVHAPNDLASVQYRNNSQYPQRSGFDFIGWSEDSNATQPDPGLGRDDEGTAILQMTSDKRLYAVWSPIPIPLPEITGRKYMTTVEIQGEEETEKTDLYTGHPEEFTAVIRLESAPSEISDVPKVGYGILDENGFFTIPQRFFFTVAGVYTFTIVEQIPADADAAIAYDTATWRLTVHVGQTVNGLEILSARMARNDVDQPDFDLYGDNAFSFTNVKGRRDVTVTKVWNDGSNADNLRPSSITVNLYGNDKRNPVGATVLSAENGWSHTFTGLPTTDSGTGNQPIAYTVEEETFDQDDSYAVEYSGNVNTGLIITNTHEIETVDVIIDKVWRDDNDAYGTRPDQIQCALITYGPGNVELKREWVYLQANDQGLWHGEFQMPKYEFSSAGGQLPLSYGVEEIVPNGYVQTDMERQIIADPANDGETMGYVFTLTNTAKVNVVIRKVVTGTMADTQKAFSFKVELLDEAGNTLPINAGEGYTVEDGAACFALVADETMLLRGLLLDTGYAVRVTEMDVSDYEMSYGLLAGGERTPVEGSSFTVPIQIQDGLKMMVIEVINHKDATIDTGVHLDSGVWWLLVVTSLAVAVYMVRSRKRRDDY